MICLLGLLIIPVLFYKQTHHLKASWILNHFSNFNFLPILLSLALLDLSLYYFCAIPAREGVGGGDEIWIPIKNISSLSLFEIQFTIMSSHVEQSHCDTLSGFNHSESQRERRREGERARERIKWPFFFCCNGRWPVLQTPSSSPKAQHWRVPESAALVTHTHTHTHTHRALVPSVPLNADRWLIAPLCVCGCVCMWSQKMKMLAQPRCTLPKSTFTPLAFWGCVWLKNDKQATFSGPNFLPFLNPGTWPCELQQHMLYSKRMINPKLAHKCYFQH